MAPTTRRQLVAPAFASRDDAPAVLCRVNDETRSHDGRPASNDRIGPDHAIETDGNADETDREKDERPSRKRRMKFSRSRGGCLTCRLQKKKCDQERPICQRCKVACRSCQYAVEQSPSGLTPWPDSQVGSAVDFRHPTQPHLSTGSGPPNTGTSTPQNNLDFFSSVFLGQAPWNTFSPTQQPAPAMAQPSVPDLTNPPSNGCTAQLPDTFGASNPGTTWPTHAPCINAANGGTLAHAELAFSGLDLSIDDEFLRSFLVADTFMPIPSVIPIPADQPTGQATDAAAFSNMEDTLPSAALLSVPLDCDSALWSSFVDSSLWTPRPVNSGSNGHLMEYFTQIAATTVVVRNAPNSASRFYNDLATSASADEQSALSHAVLCVSAQHLANWSRMAGDKHHAITFADQATAHKRKALHLLRVSTADKSKKDDASGPAVMVMLILSAILKGESDILPSFLQRTHALLSKVDNPSDHPFLPTVSAIHSVYSGFHLLARGTQISPSSLFTSWDGRTVWQEQAEAVCELIAGVKKSMFLNLLRAHSIVVELDTIAKAAERNKDDDELAFMRMELESEASIMKTELVDDGLFDEKYRKGCSERTVLGHEMYRAAISVLITKGVFDLDSGNPRLTRCVADMLRLAEGCSPGLEIGLVWPYIIVASEADESQQECCSRFIERCQWKGSAGPRIAAKVVEEVWRAREQGSERKWRDVIIALGSPLIV